MNAVLESPPRSSLPARPFDLGDEASYRAWRAHKLATADAIVFATAQVQGASLLTCDRHFQGLQHRPVSLKLAFFGRIRLGIDCRQHLPWQLHPNQVLSA